MASITYRPEIDGLRAFAITIVVLFHLIPAALPGGYLGVDIFFVISGYLITSIILADFKAGRFSLRDFWARRIRRILPAAAFLLICVLAAAVLLEYPQRALSIVGRQAVASVTFLANFALQVMAGDYWAPAAETLVLLHHWSLAVEEQFYLIYPAVLLTLLAFSSRTAAIILALVGGLSLAAYLLMATSSPSSVFFLTHYRIWELLAGCLLVFTSPKNVSDALGWLSLILILVAIAGAPYLGPEPGFAAVLAVAGTSLFIYASTAKSPQAAWLTQPAVVTLGKASYSFYLWHWPCIVFAATIATLVENDYVKWASIPFMIVGTYVSYVWIESWGRRLKSPYVFAGITLPILLGLSLWAAVNSREPITPGIGRPSWLARSYDCVQNPPIFLIGDKHVGFNLPPAEANLLQPDSHKTGILTGAAGSKANWYLLGDSHALMWANQLARYAESRKKTMRVYAGIGLSPLLTKTPGAGLDLRRRTEFNNSRLEALAQDQPEVVILAMRWDTTMRAGLMPKVVELIDKIHELTPETKIVLVGQPPLADINVNAPQWVSWRLAWGMPVETAPLADQTDSYEARAMLNELKTRHPSLTFCDPASIFISKNRVTIVDQSEILYRDDDHLSEEGAARAINLITKSF